MRARSSGRRGRARRALRRGVRGGGARAGPRARAAPAEQGSRSSSSASARCTRGCHCALAVVVVAARLEHRRTSAHGLMVVRSSRSPRGSRYRPWAWSASSCVQLRPDLDQATRTSTCNVAVKAVSGKSEDQRSGVGTGVNRFANDPPMIPADCAYCSHARPARTMRWLRDDAIVMGSEPQQAVLVESEAIA